MLLAPGASEVSWELFHENSKTSKYNFSPSEEEVVARMGELHESLPYDGYPVVDIPPATPKKLHASLSETITRRCSALELAPKSVSFDDMTTLLFHAYGVNRDNRGTSFPRPFRTSPSAGALYPLELFFHSTRVLGLKPGLYHYNPSKNHLRLLREGDATEAIARGFVQPGAAQSASVHVFLTAVFERSTFKYGDRGYRYALLEAGHVAQNLNLAATALNYGCVNIGGFFDRKIDQFLGLDGLTHSTIYMTLIGQAVR